jgi:hypothetical protein
MERSHSPLPYMVNAYLFEAAAREPPLKDKPVPVTRLLELAQCFPRWQRNRAEPSPPPALVSMGAAARPLTCWRYADDRLQG